MVGETECREGVFADGWSGAGDGRVDAVMRLGSIEMDEWLGRIGEVLAIANGVEARSPRVLSVEERSDLK